MLVPPLKQRNRILSRRSVKPPLPNPSRYSTLCNTPSLDCNKILAPTNNKSQDQGTELRTLRRRSINSCSSIKQHHQGLSVSSSYKIYHKASQQNIQNLDPVCLLSIRPQSSRIVSAFSEARIRLKSRLPSQSKHNASLSNAHDTTTSTSTAIVKRPTPKQNLIHNENTYLTERTLTGKISAKAWIAYDLTKREVVYEKKSFAKRQMASLTKIMTCLIAIETVASMGVDPTQLICTISRRAAEINGTRAQLPINSRLSINDLLYGLMLPSGNDAAIAIAEAIGTLLLDRQYLLQEAVEGGKSLYKPDIFEQRCKTFSKRSTGVFIQQMNRKAQELLMTRTNYANPHGLGQRNNYSTCEDLAKLCQYCVGHSKQFMRVVNTQNYSAKCAISGQTWNWSNTHKLLAQGWKGIKTGVTPNAGPCLSSYFKGKDAHMIIILLDCRSMEARYEQTKLLMETWRQQSQ